MSVPIVRELSPFDKIRKKYGQDFLTRLDTWSKEDSGYIPFIHRLEYFDMNTDSFKRFLDVPVKP